MAPNLLPYFNADGCYLHALIAVGQHRIGDKSFYASMIETAPPNEQAPTYNPTNSVEMADTMIQQMILWIFLRQMTILTMMRGNITLI